jgi:tetratricopeptide (TPR) repeat protein
MGEGDHARAAAILEKIATTEFVTAGDWVNWGTALTNLKEYDAARLAFEEALRREPSLATAERMLGRVALETGDLDEASARFERARASEPEHALGQYLALYTLWRAAGDAAALERLGELTAGGIQVGRFIREAGPEWEAAGPELQSALSAAASAVEGG